MTEDLRRSRLVSSLDRGFVPTFDETIQRMSGLGTADETPLLSPNRSMQIDQLQSDGFIGVRAARRHLRLSASLNRNELFKAAKFNFQIRPLVVYPARTPSAAPPAKRARCPSASSIRKASFHCAMRSERAKEPTLSWPASQPTARCTMVMSSVSPERAEMIVVSPVSRAAVSAESVSVSVPAWFGLISAGGAPPAAAAPRTRAASVTRKSSPTTCTRAP